MVIVFEYIVVLLIFLIFDCFLFGSLVFIYVILMVWVVLRYDDKRVVVVD